MQNTAMATNESPKGFLLLNAHLSPIFVNYAAAQILAYPEEPQTHKNLCHQVGARIRSILVSGEPSNGSVFVARFQSGRRHYVCRSFSVDGIETGDLQASFAIILERASTTSTLVAQLFDRFHLTAREQEVAQFLSQGLTSKEIGARMQISPNTVKAFLRLIMVKMGVTTRSGVVGKALNAQ
jgi:DNA-binding CsgD family transcriptional regulator